MKGKVGSKGDGKGLGIGVISKQAMDDQIQSVHNKSRSEIQTDDIIGRLPLTLFVGAKRVTAVAPLLDSAERRWAVETALASVVSL